MSRGITWLNTGADGGDFISAARSFGVPHPTGYPTYTLLLRIFGDVVTIGDHAFRANLFSALTGAATVPFIYLATLRILNRIPAVEVGGYLVIQSAAGVAALSFATSRLFWSQTAITEVYTLNALFGAVLIVLTLDAATALEKKESAIRLRVVMALIFALGLGNHTSLGLTGTPFGIWILWLVWQQQGWKGLLDWRPAAGFLVGLSVYAYLPIAALNDPIVIWGTPNSPSGIFEIASGSIFYGLAFGVDGTDILGRISTIFELLFAQFRVLGALLGFVGLMTVWKYHQGFAIAAISSIVVLAGYALTYATFDSFIYLISVYLVFAIWLGVGIALLAHGIRRYSQRHFVRLKHVSLAVILLAVVVFPMWSLVFDWGEVDLSRKKEPAEYAQMAVSRATNGIILAEDPKLFALVYEAQVASPEQRTMVISPLLISNDWYWDTLVKHYSDRMPLERPRSTLGRVQAILKFNIESMPVYATHNEDFQYPDYQLTQDDGLFLVKTKDVGG